MAPLSYLVIKSFITLGVLYINVRKRDIFLGRADFHQVLQVFASSNKFNFLWSKKKWRRNVEHGDTLQNKMQQNDLDLNNI